MADPLSAIDALTPDQRAQFLSGTLTLVYDCPKQLTAEEIADNIALYRQDPLFFEVNPRPPESAGVGK